MANSVPDTEKALFSLQRRNQKGRGTGISCIIVYFSLPQHQFAQHQLLQLATSYNYANSESNQISDGRSNLFMDFPVASKYPNFFDEKYYLKMESMCYLCQDFEISTGHETKLCPYSECKLCGQKGHFKMHCTENIEIKIEHSSIEIKEEFDCEICLTKESSEDKFYNHLVTVHFKKKLLIRYGIGKFTCGLCQKIFTEAHLFMEHAALAHDKTFIKGN